ncbi:NAD-dependent epimerase/dehydratase family protein [Peribacillus alkalitolerans]|uniref:NAD-dependent epimerase/dehydratase family protein n=1 Tax=Peribacillus alkalitolerans TaxID=1550385 RepID=UPI0013D28C35|nr:NAD(P)H-binding protein [Peribacillus alkalitolerans]
MKQRSALVLGASGLIGSELVRILLDSHEYSQVTILVRRELPYQHHKLSQIVTDFDRLDNYDQAFRVDDVYSCLGTTIKKAKSKDNFHNVDYEYTMKAAHMAAKFSAGNFLTVTALGADPNSLFFYNRVKGKVERELKRLVLPSVHIFQPSLLLGDRNEYRQGEKIAEAIGTRLSFLFVGPLQKYKPIEAKRVAKGMYERALQSQKGFFIHRSESI